jgi:hypothetical protein
LVSSVLHRFYRCMCWLFNYLVMKSTSRAENDFVISKNFWEDIEFFGATYAFYFHWLHLTSSCPKYCSISVCFSLTVMQLIPQTGQETNWYSPTSSNSKLALHPGHKKVMELTIFCICTLLKINIVRRQLRDTLVIFSNYIENFS